MKVFAKSGSLFFIFVLTGLANLDMGYEAAKAAEQVVASGPTVATGGEHTCATDIYGVVSCWGSNQFGQTNVPGDLGQVTEITAGAEHTCVITVEKTVRCWGGNTEGQTSVPSLQQNMVHIDAGLGNTCAIDGSSRLSCWGSNSHGQSRVPAGLGEVTQVTLGAYHTCALSMEGDVRCWGYNRNGETLVPLGMGKITQVEAGWGHTCALNEQGKVFCWGYDEAETNFGQTKVPSELLQVKQIATLDANSCALTIANEVKCWGANTFGLNSTPSNFGTIEQLVGGGSSSHACIVNSVGQVKCWGNNRNLKSTIPSTPRINQISTGGYHSCVILETDTINCWGPNVSGETLVPLNLPKVKRVSASTGGAHTCVVTVTGGVVCWGENSKGQTAAPTGVNSVDVSAGGNFTCSLSATGIVSCWGYNGDGQSTVPNGIGKIVQLSAANEHVCALNDQGDVKCWGYNGSGRTAVPSGLGKVTQISAGGAHTCTLNNLGAVRCWGSNRLGQSSVPMGLGTVIQIVTGLEHTCSLNEIGKVTCWGDNEVNQTNVPGDLGKIAQLTSGGGYHTCALSYAGKVTCWGYSQDGRINVPTPFNSNYLGEVLNAEKRIKMSSTPRIAFSSEMNNTLVVQMGDWEPGVTFTYEWKKDNVPLIGESRNNLVLSLSDLGSYVSVRTTGHKDGYKSITLDSAHLRVSKINVQNLPCGLPGTIDVSQTFDKSKPTITGSSFNQTLRGWTGLWDSGTKYCMFWTSEEQVTQSRTTTYKTVGTDVGKHLRFVVVGTKNNLSTVRVSDPVFVSKAVFIKAKSPTIRGVAKVGVKLSGSVSSWESGTSYTYQWLRDNEPILGANTLNYIPTAADNGSNLSIRVCGFKAFYEDLCLSSSSQIVQSGVITKAGTVSISGKSTNPGALLTGVTTQWMAGVNLQSQWLLNGSPIQGATNPQLVIQPSYRGGTLTYQVTGSMDGYQSISKTSPGKKIP